MNEPEKEYSILHITVVRELSAGQRKQLKSEYSASKKMERNITWKTLAFHTGKIHEKFERKIPIFFRLILLRNLYAWIIVLKTYKKYDFILLRHITFDPFAFIFAPMIPNRISVHHAKEVEELRLVRSGFAGKIASHMEKFFGKIAVKYALGILGVTREIATYQQESRGLNKQYSTYENGIDFSSIPIAADNRKKDEVNAVFICGNFSSWHGLDRLIEAVDSFEFSRYGIALRIHLVGKLTDLQTIELKRTNKRNEVFKCYGTLNMDEYYSIVNFCDIGIGSLALDRKKLREAATLKVRELLAMGLPIYSGHIDSSLDESFRFYHYAGAVDIKELMSFALTQKGVSRETVRMESLNYIEKINIMKKTAQILATFKD